MQVAAGKVVNIHYTLKDDEGEVIDSSEGRDPLAYLHGHGNIVAGLESALEGSKQGDSLEVSVSPEQGYGERQEAMVQVAPISAFQGIDKIEPGMQFQAQTPEGPRAVTVTAVEDDQVTVDANHPLAGQTLNFAVEVTEVREASAEELEHGHVHGPGGHQH